MIWTWVAAGGALVLGFLLSTLFHALRDFSLRKLEALAAQNGGPGNLRAIVDDPDGHARAVGFLRVVVNMVAVIAIVIAFAPLIVVEAGGADGASAVARLRWGAILGASATSVAAVFVCSMLIPVSLARHAGEHIIHSAAGVIRVIHAMLLPLQVLDVFDLAVKRLVGEGATTEHQELEDELLSAVSEGERGGRLGASERDMIEGIVELAEKTAEEIMTPRTDIEGLELTDELERIKEFIGQAGHSRIPVYEGDLDHLVGLLYAKDLIPFVGDAADGFSLRPILRDILFVPESKPVNDLLLELRATSVHLAIVLDEYGGTAGLVTLEDILEEIVGDIRDEFEPETERDPEILVDADARTAEVDARAHIADANDALAAIGVELPEDEDYDTVGGYILSALGHIPVADECMQADGHRVVILEAEPTRITRLRIEAVVEEPAPEEGAALEERDDGEAGAAASSSTAEQRSG